MIFPKISKFIDTEQNYTVKPRFTAVFGREEKPAVNRDPR